MQIAKNTVVTLKYTVRDPDGNMIDDGQHPLVPISRRLRRDLPKLEEELHGRIRATSSRSNSSRTTPSAITTRNWCWSKRPRCSPRTSRSGCRSSGSPTMAKKRSFIASPTLPKARSWSMATTLAGIALLFDVTVAEVRPATAEEVTSHGHVHGAGGHHH